MLAGLTAVIAVPAAAGTVAGCADKAPDPLIALVEQARADATLLDAAARAWQTPPAAQPQRPTGPITSTLLSAVGEARRVHADKLAEELGDDAPPAPAPPPAGQTGPGAQEPKAALAAVLTALDTSQRNASVLVPGLSRHRAALVGSVAACCAAYRSVLL